MATKKTWTLHAGMLWIYLTPSSYGQQVQGFGTNIGTTQENCGHTLSDVEVGCIITAASSRPFFAWQLAFIFL